jgi:hypothetical protein
LSVRGYQALLSPVGQIRRLSGSLRAADRPNLPGKLQNHEAAAVLSGLPARHAEPRPEPGSPVSRAPASVMACRVAAAPGSAAASTGSPAAWQTAAAGTGADSVKPPGETDPDLRG